jgi:hypothetical protein
MNGDHGDFNGQVCQERHQAIERRFEKVECRIENNKADTDDKIEQINDKLYRLLLMSALTLLTVAGGIIGYLIK